MKRYNQIIRDFREDKDLTQEDIAKVINLTQSAYSKIERGERELRIEDLIKICHYLHVRSEEIMGI